MTDTANTIEYDVCVAYATEDTKATGRLRDWSTKLVKTLSMRLSPRGYEQDPFPPQLKCYSPNPAALDWEALRVASAKSTLLFVIVSPEFCNAPGAVGVVKAFLAANAARGGTADSIIAITAFPLPDKYAGDAVMTRFISSGEGRRADFYDEIRGEPVEYALAATGSGPFVALLQPIAELAYEIRDKLKTLGALGFRIGAGAAPAGPAPALEAAQPAVLLIEPPAAAAEAVESEPNARDADDELGGIAITAQLYLRGDCGAALWDETRTAFRKVAIVSPEAFTQDASGVTLRQRRDARENRINELATCNAMALVRATDADALLGAAKAALWDLNYIRQNSDPDFAWILADWVGDPAPALPEGLMPPRVFPNSPDFAKQVQAVMAPR